MSGRMGSNSVEKMSHSKSGQVISWCPSCYVQFTETTIPAIERQGGARPFEMTPFLRFLCERLAQLTQLLRRPVKMRVALHRHPGVAGVMEAAAEILRAIPSIELVDLKQPGRLTERRYQGPSGVQARIAAQRATGRVGRRH
jgi:heterodisulfide reductase subunit D